MMSACHCSSKKATHCNFIDTLDDTKIATIMQSEGRDAGNGKRHMQLWRRRHACHTGQQQFTRDAVLLQAAPAHHWRRLSPSSVGLGSCAITHVPAARLAAACAQQQPFLTGQAARIGCHDRNSWCECGSGRSGCATPSPAAQIRPFDPGGPAAVMQGPEYLACLLPSIPAGTLGNCQ